MEDFHHNGKSVQFMAITGEVLDHAKRSETHTSMHTQTSVQPTAPLITPHGVIGQPGRVSTSTTMSTRTEHFHEIWLRTDDGREQPVEIGRGDIPLRTGQYVTLVVAHRDKKHACGGLLVNHTAKAHWKLSDGLGIVRHFKLERLTGLSIVGALALLWAIVYFSAPSPTYASGPLYYKASWGIAWGVALSFFAYRAVRKVLRFKAASKRVDAHLEALADACYRRVG